MWVMHRSVMVYASAGKFALGIAFFWPTMIGFVSENIARAVHGTGKQWWNRVPGGAISQPVRALFLSTDSCFCSGRTGTGSTLKCRSGNYRSCIVFPCTLQEEQYTQIRVVCPGFTDNLFYIFTFQKNQNHIMP
jgi:hypothetical protein